ncbi:hypothetical protein E8E13_004287 [Curvularia kusanoi]|uniref:Adenosine deaminase domain-containing protein n=1 Tax=Curvularia kusanoi TaxID=90978 RepID=A0A9P4T8B4_CURKU|nr:hypothetical protein E8E13_004287 [Curvularia kusanoi]
MTAVPLKEQSFAHRLPKIELHAHLTGSISRACLHSIWETVKGRDAAFDVQDPLTAIPTDKVDYDLETFFPLFSSYIYKLCSDLPSIERYSTNAVLQDFQADGVVYLELRTTPRAIPEKGITKDDYVKAVLNVLNAWNQDKANTLRAYLILSVDRRNNIAQAEEVVDLCIKYSSTGVVGIDLCGDPAKGDVRIFADSFARAKAAGLKMTLHFAEAEVSASDIELETLLSWKPDRLGHVIHVKDSDHHFGMWRHTNVPVALSTDDVGVFCSPLSNEYALAMEHFDLSRAEIRTLCTGVIDSIFTGDDEKDRLRLMYAEWDGWAI